MSTHRAVAIEAAVSTPLGVVLERSQTVATAADATSA